MAGASEQIDRFSTAAEGWRIIAGNPDPRVSARELCRLFAKVLEASTVGMEFHDPEGYSWREQVEQVGIPVSTGHWEKPFPDGKSLWFFEGGMDRITEFDSVLDLLSEQWIRCERPTRKPSARLLVKPMSFPFNPAWIAVSRFSRTVLFRLPELCQSVRPLLLIGETGSGRNYLAQLIHRSGPDPFSPFTSLEEKASKESGTLFIPDWEHRTAQERKSLLQDERRIIAAMTPGKDVDDIIRAWELSTSRTGQMMRVPSLRERRKDIPLLASHFLEIAARSIGRITPGISPVALEVLKTHRWDGNARELAEAMSLSMESLPYNSPLLEVENLPPAIRGAEPKSAEESFAKRLIMLECDMLEEELRRQNGNITHTARAMGLTPRQVSWRLKKYGINSREFKPKKPPGCSLKRITPIDIP